MALAHSPSIVTNGLVFYYDMNNTQKSFKGAPTTNLISASGLDASALGSYPLLEVTRVEDPESFSGYAMQLRITSTSINGASRATMGTSASIPTSGTTYVSVYAKSMGATSTIRPSVFTGGGWFILQPLDGGSIYLTSEYRRFGALCTMSTSSGGPTPAFSTTNSGPTSDTTTMTRWHSPQCEVNTFATPFVAGTRSNTQAVVDLTNNVSITATDLTYNSNQTFSFNGTTNRLDCGNPAILNFGLGNFTVSAWFNRSNNATSNSRLISKAGADDTASADSAGFSFFGSNSGMSFAINPTATRSIVVAANYSIGEWVNVTGVLERGVSMRAYKNASLTASATAPSGSVSGTRSLFIGDNLGSGLRWPGEIPIVSIYNRALTDLEIQQNYNALKGRFGL
jgi:hypothetical protein